MSTEQGNGHLGLVIELSRCCRVSDRVSRMIMVRFLVRVGVILSAGVWRGQNRHDVSTHLRLPRNVWFLAMYYVNILPISHCVFPGKSLISASLSRVLAPRVFPEKNYKIIQ